MSAFTLQTYPASDGYRWQYRRYEPPAAPRGHVVCIHGIQSHGGWYEHSCTQIAAAGYRISFLDRRGSGLNQEARGDAPGFRRLLDDLAEFLLPLHGDKLPVFLLAISWGGKLAAALQRRHPGLVKGLVLLCPGFYGKQRPPFLQRMGILCSRLFRPKRLFQIPLNEPELFTASPQWQQFLRDDPLRLRLATARLLLESVRLDMYLRWVPKCVTMPVLLLLAGQDHIIHNEPTRKLLDRFATTDRQLIEYPEAHHTLEFEPDPERHVKDIVQWLDKH